MALPSGLTFNDIDLTQVDKNSPVDEQLMGDVAEDLYYLKAQLAAGGGGVFEAKVNGNLSALRNVLPFRRIDAAYVLKATTLSSYAMFLEIAGTSGTLECDVRKYVTPATGITGIDYQYQANINSITRAGSAGSTQTITKATPQVNTQSISFWKASINVNSIVHLGGGIWRYNLATAPDSDHVALDYVTFASCTTGANNGTFKTIAFNSDGGFNVDIANPSGVAQTGAAGNMQLQAMAYNLTNPAAASFVAGESALFASHTTGANNGTFAIYAVNQGANNIIVKNSAGVVQAGVAGTCDSLRWIYTLGATASSDLVVGENGLFASHTTTANNGNLPIKVVSGTQVTVYNVSGALQGSAAGTVDSNRWVYALASDPSTSFSVGQTFYASTAVTSYANQGVLTVKQINRSATNNLVVYNESGVTQAGAAGTATHTRRLVKFAADQSSVYAVTKSRILIKGIADAYILNQEFDVVEVNRGGGANYNVVINDATGLSVSQASPAGRVAWESRSVFSTRPSFTSTQDLQIASNGVLDTTEKVVAANSILATEILQIPAGNPQNLSVQVA